MLHYLISSPNLHPSQSCSSTPLSLLCYPILPHTTLFTPLSLTLLFSLNSPSHLSFNPIFSHTTLLTPSLSHHSFHAILPHSFHPILPHTILFTSFSLTPLFSLHSSSHHSFHTILSNTTLFTPLSHFILLFL